ncbi:MAG: L-tyrosine/L-tryptophan isonitrile synthase family protein [Bacteroidetes bacterium]|nr:L-tyrosine/L-tryptophan isonitrile synthase family protein [Bacteroidota bacterium]
MEKPVEILQASSLETCKWPEEDPHGVPQRTRIRVDEDVNLIKDCLSSAKIDRDAFVKNARKEKLTKAETIMRILAHEKFQMNGKEVRNEPKWIKSVETAIHDNKPIDLVYPQFCVIPNAPKRYTNMGTAAGEDTTIEFFKFINEHIKWYHEPGIRVHALADASLYASAFQTHQTEVDAYYDSLKDRITALNAGDCVHLYDYSELLRTECRTDYQRLYYKLGQKAWASPIEELLPNTDIPTLRRSVRCSVNTRRFQLSHKDHLALFGPMEQRNEKHPFWNTIEAMTDIAFREVVTIRLACGDIDIASRLWPEAIRASCHKGQKNGRWAVGLRTYPEYFGSCKLLPYHGMPIIRRSGKGKPKLEIEPEVMLRSREDLIRVTIGDTDEVYAYISEDIEKERMGSSYIYATPKGMRNDEFNSERWK